MQRPDPSWHLKSVTSNNRWIAAASFLCFAFGLALSHRIEPGVHVQKVMLAEDTPALKFIPTGAGPHPVALLAHGYAASKETLFRYGEALAAAGFVCYSVDQPGHGASRRTFTFMEAVRTLEAVAREVGPVDVLAGHSLGGATGGEAVREGGMKPQLFLAVGCWPILGEHAPPLLLLLGRFDEALTPATLAYLNARTDARLVFSPWSDHALAAVDPVLVNTAVQAAGAAVHKTAPAPPTAWRWRLLGAVLAMLAAGLLASCLMQLFPQLAPFRGLFVGVFIVAACMLTLGGRWLDPIPHFRLQAVAVPVTFLVAVIAGKLHIPRWSFAALGVLLMGIAVSWLKASGTHVAGQAVVITFILTPVLVAGTLIGWIASRCGSRLQGDIAMAIFLGCVPFQFGEPPRTASEAPKPHVANKLDPKLLDACVGQYRFPSDNVFFIEWKLTIRRQGDQLIGQKSTVKDEIFATFELHSESETNFFFKPSVSAILTPALSHSPEELTFIKNDRGDVTSVVLHRCGQGLPDSEGKKFKTKSSSTVAPPYYVVRYEGSTNPGELKFGVSYALWLPPGVKTLRGVIVHQHGCGGWAWQEGELAVCDLHWQALARKHGCALLGASYEEPYNCDCGYWSDPRYGSDKRFQQALADLARQSHHPELESVPWALWGHSGGAYWVGTMLLLHPERVIGVWLRSSAPLVLRPPIPIDELRPLGIPAAACSVPVMCNLGAQEGITIRTNQFALVWDIVQPFFREMRRREGLVGVAVEPNNSHNCGNSRYLAIPWFDACLSARLPEKAGETQLLPMPAENAWLAPLLGNKAEPAAKFAGDAKNAIWLPNERIAKAWMQYVKDGNVSDTTPPPAPIQVRASPTGELSWEAEADLESGLAAFIIERNGVEFARVPKKLSGYFDGRPTFQRVGYGDAPALPLAEMCYRDHRFNWFRKHSYAVRAVNSVGLKSESAPAVEMNRSNMPPGAVGFPYEAILKQWPKAPEQPKLAKKFLDAVTGHYQFAPSAAFPAGAKVTLRWEGNQLVWEVSGQKTIQGVFNIIPETETNFFVKPLEARLTFIKDSKGQVTAVVHHLPWAETPDCEGKKLK